MLVIIFLGIFMLILTTVSSFALEEEKYGQALMAREQALTVAESGLEYYRWYLSHFPNDLTNGTSTPGPYPYVVKDPETGDVVGTAQISVSAKIQCGIVQWIDITATGTSALDANYTRATYARYMKPSVAGYSYLLNSNVWAGASRTINGPYFSNGGIRMDAVSNSDVSSAQSTWTCNSSFGCSPTATKNGIFGSSTNSVLWHFPSATVDFSGGLALQLITLKTVAQNYGLYFATSTGTPGQRGYHFVFQSDGTVNVYRVTSVVAGILSSADGSNFTPDYSVINTQTFLGSYALPASCRVIFAEDNIWVDGTVKNPITIGAADYTGSPASPNAYLHDNILYTNYDGSDGLTIIADNNVLLPLDSPDTMEIHGIFVAHNGLYGRNYYTTSGSFQVPSAYTSFVLQTQLTTVGSVVSNLRTGTAWMSGNSVISGYQTRIDSYDQLQALGPPPLTPPASPTATFVNWDER